MDAHPVVCARCGQPTPRALACARCGEDPRLDSRYWLLEVLGTGAFGTTYRAERESDGATFALKELLVRRLQDFKAHDLFKREANMLRSLSHPAIPAYIDDFMAGEGRHVGLYLVVELVEGRTLADELLVRRLDTRAALETVRELCDVLTYLHERTPPIVHRDLKPGNVMRRADGRLALIDFGSVKDVVRQGEAGSTVAGTFGYMPPEQLAGRASPASDIYALGVILLELVTRQPPHELLDEQNRLVWEPFVDDGPLRELLRGMLQPEPSKRIASAHEVAEQIDALLAGKSARPAPPVLKQLGRAAGGMIASDAAANLAQRRGVAGQLQQVVGMLQGMGLTSGVAPGQADPPPDAPRKVPSGFARKVDPVANFFRIFGVAFGLPATFVIGSILLQLGGGFSAGMAPFLLFPLLGTLFFVFGMVRIGRAKTTFEDGLVAEATITDVSVNTSLRVNGRSPYRIAFEFTDESLVHRRASVSRFDVPMQFRIPGAKVYAIYRTDKPDKAVLWPL